VHKATLALLLTMVIVLSLVGVATAGSIEIVVDGVSIGHNPYYLKTETPPYMEGGRTMVPIRAIAEALGFTVEWKTEGNLIILRGSNKEIVMNPNIKAATINGNKVTLDIPPKLKGSSTFIPLRFVSETLGYNVYYSNATKNRTGAAAEIFITSYNVLKDDEVTKIKTDSANFYQVPARNEKPAYLCLKAKGQTPSGIKIGDDLAMVLKAYGIPAEPSRNTSSYTSDWTGTLGYLSTFAPKGKSCYGYTLEITINKGYVKEIQFISPE